MEGNSSIFLAVCVALLAVSEIIALIPGSKVKSNSVFQLVINVLKMIVGAKKSTGSSK